MPDPLHPAIVHLPLGLAFLAPLLFIAVVVAITREWIPRRAYLAVVVLQALLFGLVILAKETGEDQEHRVEEVVPHEAIETHEDRADLLAIVALVALLAAGLGLLPRRKGTVARSATVLLALLVTAAAIRVGVSGGALVYEHGAARVYWQHTHPGEPADER